MGTRAALVAILAGEFCKVGNAAYRRYGYICPATRHLRRG
jgi:hypothetical protein